MTVITPVGGIIGPRPTGASFRTGVWKQQEVFEWRVDGVWATPAYPDLAPYAANANGEILVGTYNAGSKTTVGNTQTTLSYVKPGVKVAAGGVCLNDSRWAYIYTQAVTNSLNWRFQLRYYDDPTGANIFGLPVQTSNVQRVAQGNSCHNMNSFRLDYTIPGGAPDYRYFYHDEALGCTGSGQDYGLLGAQSTGFLYNTQLAVSSTRFPFGVAPYVNTDNGIDNYYVYSQADRPISMWLLPP